MSFLLLSQIIKFSGSSWSWLDPFFYDGAKTTKQETTLLRKLISCQPLFRFQPKMSEPRKMNEPNFDEIGNFFCQVCKNHGNSFNWLRFIDNFGPTVQGSVRSGSISWIHLLARSWSGNQIHLPVSLYKPCAMYICMLVSSCHPKTNKLLDTLLHLLPFLTYWTLSFRRYLWGMMFWLG